MAQKAILPVRYLRMTQGRDITTSWLKSKGYSTNRYSHYKICRAFDFGPWKSLPNSHATIPSKARICHPPYDCRVVNTIPNEGVVFLESIGDVQSPNGVVGKQWMALVHTETDIRLYQDLQRTQSIIYQNESQNAHVKKVLGDAYFYLMGGRQYGINGNLDEHLHLEAGYGSCPIVNSWDSYTHDGVSSTRISYYASFLEDLLYVHPDTEIVETNFYNFTYTTGVRVPIMNMDGGGADGGDVGGGPLDDDNIGGGNGNEAAYQEALSRYNAAASNLAAANARIATEGGNITAKLNTLQSNSTKTLNDVGTTIDGWVNRLQPRADALNANATSVRQLL